MTPEEKGKLIWRIIDVLKSQAILHNKAFDLGNTFIDLVFLPDDKLIKIASVCGIGTDHLEGKDHA